MDPRLTQEPIADTQVSFILQVCLESPELIDRSLGDLRTWYLGSNILVIFDGVNPSPEMMRVVSRHAAMMHVGQCLKKGLHNGAALWTRLFAFGVMFNTDFVVKMDPDARVHRRLTAWPVNENLVCGKVMSPEVSARHIQGGFQVMTRAFLAVALPESRKEEYRNPDHWKSGQSYIFANKGAVSMDYSLSAIMRNVGAAFVEQGEMDCRSVRGERPFIEDAAVTHPRKDPNN